MPGYSSMLFSDVSNCLKAACILTQCRLHVAFREEVKEMLECCLGFRYSDG